MFTHVSTGSDDTARSKAPCGALFAAIGGKPGGSDARRRLAYVHNGGCFMATAPSDGQATTHAIGGTIGFATASPAEADASHRAGVENGGAGIEDRPGVRPGASGPPDLANLRDPDGDKLCALHRMGLTPAARGAIGT